MRTPVFLITCCLCAATPGILRAQEATPLPPPNPIPAGELPVNAGSLPADVVPTTPPSPLPSFRGQPPPMLPPVMGHQGVYGHVPYAGFSTTAAMMPVAQQAPYYWRVGTRNCKQTFRGGICVCQLDVCGCGPDGQWKPSSLPQMLATISDGAPICVMAHGSLVDELGSRIDARGTYRWLRNAAPQMPLHVIFFDWPSERTVGPHAAVQFLQLGRQAARNGFPLAKLVAKFPPESPVCLIGHSHGARLVCAATHLMGGGSVQGRALANPDRHHRIRLVLAAAAIDHHWLNPGERYSQTVCRVESIISIENRQDLALLLYPLQRPLGTPALGQKGLYEADEQALGMNRRKIFHLNVTSAIGKRHVWPYYYNEPRIATTIASSVFFPDIYQPVQVQPMQPVDGPASTLVPPSPVGPASRPTYWE